MKTARITIKDIARDCGVGLGTVSRVINDKPGVKDEVRRAVRQYIEDVGWRANSLRGRFSLGPAGCAVALIASASLLERKYDADALRTLLDSLAQSRFVPFALFGAMPENLERVAGSPLHGVVIFGARAIHNPAIAALRARGVRCVVVGGANGVEAPQVDSAHERAAARLMRRFRSRGHTRIGFFSGMGMRKRIRSAADVPLPRVQAILKGVMAADPGFDPAASAVSDCFDDLSALRRHLRNATHTAWLCGSEKACRQFLCCAATLGRRIPEDVSLAALTPDLPPYAFVPDVDRMYPDNAALARAVMEGLEDSQTRAAEVNWIDCRFRGGATLAEPARS